MRCSLIEGHIWALMLPECLDSATCREAFAWMQCEANYSNTTSTAGESGLRLFIARDQAHSYSPNALPVWWQGLGAGHCLEARSQQQLVVSHHLYNKLSPNRPC